MHELGPGDTEQLDALGQPKEARHVQRGDAIFGGGSRVGTALEQDAHRGGVIGGACVVQRLETLGRRGCHVGPRPEQRFSELQPRLRLHLALGRATCGESERGPPLVVGRVGVAAELEQRDHRGDVALPRGSQHERSSAVVARLQHVVAAAELGENDSQLNRLAEACQAEELACVPGRVDGELGLG